MKRTLETFFFLLRSFGPLIAFYGTNHFWGLKAAIAATVTWTIGEIVVLRMKKKPLSTFFKFTATITILFGAVDLYLQQSVLFKFEAAFSNFLVGCFFASTLFAEKAILLEFAEAQGFDKELTPDREYFFAFLTALWSVYFWAKAAVYAWLATRYSLEKALAIRLVAGNVSLYAMMAVSVFGAKPIMRALGKLRLLPSART
jgi:intracellular septation protein A